MIDIKEAHKFQRMCIRLFVKYLENSQHTYAHVVRIDENADICATLNYGVLGSPCNYQIDLFI